MKRVFLIVLDSVGAGALPDAEKYGDVGANTLGHIYEQCSPALPNMERMGLGLIPNVGGNAPVNGAGVYGRAMELSAGKDTTTGHWELTGLRLEKPFPTYPDGFPPEVLNAFEEAIGTKCIGNYAASGTVIIQDLGPEHVKTGYPIVYTSADSVFQIAAHEDVISVEKLYEICEKARKILTGEHGVARVIARPFIGNAEEGFTRTKNRKDFSLEPTGVTILDLAKEKGMEVVAIGKIEDIFEHRGMTKADHTTNNADGIEKTMQFMKEEFEGILFTNLVDTDMIYGHRNDVEGYASALEYFDSKLPEILSLLKEEDILFITADHGCDPTTESTDHSREYVPVLVYGEKVKGNTDLGVRKTFADLGQTVSDYLELGAKFEAESFLQDILK